MANNKKLRNFHAAKYIEAVFASRLQEEGFVCPDDRLLCWYRIKNNEIVNSIFFFSCWSNLPLFLQIGYGVHPLFVAPYYMTDVLLSNRPLDERLYELTIREGDAKCIAPFSDNILVYCPQADGYGVDTFNSVILPQLDSIDSLEKCYLQNRRMYKGARFGMSRTMIDEAIYLNDTHALDNCKKTVTQMLSFYKEQAEKYPNKKEYADILVQLQIQKQALWDHQHEMFLQSIEQRKQKTIKLMHRKYGISLDV